MITWLLLKMFETIYLEEKNLQILFVVLTSLTEVRGQSTMFILLMLIKDTLGKIRV